MRYSNDRRLNEERMTSVLRQVYLWENRELALPLLGTLMEVFLGQ